MVGLVVKEDFLASRYGFPTASAKVGKFLVPLFGARFAERAGAEDGI